MKQFLGISLALLTGLGGIAPIVEADTPKRGGSSITLKLPAERAGEVMVFRTFDRISYALVMNMQRPVYVNDLIRNP